MTERVSKLIGFGRLYEEETDPEIRDLHHRHLKDWDSIDWAYDDMVTKLGDTLNRAFELAEKLAMHKAVHGEGAMGCDPILEWKRLAILLEQRVAADFPDQVAGSLNQLLEDDG